MRLVLVALALSAIAVQHEGSAQSSSANAPEVVLASSATASGTAEIDFVAHATDGTTATFDTQISAIAVGSFCPADSSLPATAGQAFLSFMATTDVNSDFVGVNGVPDSGIVFVSADGERATAISNNQIGGLLTGDYCFEVPASTTSGTLEVSPGVQQNLFEVTDNGQNGNFTNLTFEPSSTVIDVPPPPPPTSTTTTPTTIPATTTPTTEEVSTLPTVHRPKLRIKPSKRQPTPLVVAAKHQASAQFPSPPILAAAGAGSGFLVLVLVLPIWRRQRFRKAEEQGRVRIYAPPVLLPAKATTAVSAMNAESSGKPFQGFEEPAISRTNILLLGPVEIRGVVSPIEKNPVRELLVFLALNPAKSFTSDELRESIWVEGRTPPSSRTMRNYLHELRASLGRDFLERDGYRYRLREPVVTDWSRLNFAMDEDDARISRLVFALDLIRGIPLEGALEGRNSPYAWASALRYAIEATVERMAHELVDLALESGDPLVADRGLSKALLCVPESVVLREDHLRIGVEVGGSSELSRRLEAAKIVLKGQAEELDSLAARLILEDS